MKRLIEERYDHWKHLFKDADPNDAVLFIARFTIEESQLILIEDLPSGEREISIVNNTEENVSEFFGYLSKHDNEIKITIQYDFRLIDWDLPLSPLYHVDLLKRVIEWKKVKDDRINNVLIKHQKDSVYFSYNIFPVINSSTTLFEIVQIGKEMDDWSRNIVFELQDMVGKFHLNISNEYSIQNTLNNYELLESVNKEPDSNKKGKLLEDLISRLFSSITGFVINERVRTETEEIDILILNKSNESIWEKESALVLIECKNWTSKCGKNELVLFKEKIKNRYGRAKIGFFISWNGFKDTIEKELLRSSQDDIIIIPVTGEQITNGMKSNDFGSVVEKWWMASVSK